ncbi:Glycoside hydrolase 2 (Mannanase, beta-galactosidase) [Asimina triloba]
MFSMPPAPRLSSYLMSVLTNLDTFKDVKKLKKVKKDLKHRFWTELYDGAKLFYLSGLLHGKYLRGYNIKKGTKLLVGLRLGKLSCMPSQLQSCPHLGGKYWSRLKWKKCDVPIQACITLGCTLDTRLSMFKVIITSQASSKWAQKDSQFVLFVLDLKYNKSRKLRQLSLVFGEVMYDSLCWEQINR